MICAALSLVMLLQEQKATVEDVLKLMEKNTASLTDLTFSVDTQADMSVGGDTSVVVRWRRGAGLRVSVVSSPKKKKDAGAGAGVMLGMRLGGLEFAYAPEGYYIWTAMGPDEKRSLAVSNMKMGWDQPAAKAVDPYFLPSGFPVRLFIDDPMVYYELEPRAFFGYEANLACEGTRVEDGRNCYVLSSHLSPSEITKKLHGSEFIFLASRKEFFVDVETGRLIRLRWSATMHQSMGGQDQDERGVLVATPGTRTEVADGVSLPTSCSWAFFDEKRGNARDTEMVHTFRSFRANTGVAAESIVSESERADLYADAALMTPAEYEAILKKDPKNVNALYSLAIARGTPSMMEAMMGGGEAKPVKILGTLEQVMTSRPEAESPVLNFLAAAEMEDGAEKAAPILEKIEAGVIRGERVRLVAASRLNAKGEHDRALKLLETAPVVEGLRRRAVLERMFALASKKDAAALAAAFSDEAARRGITAEKVMLIHEMQSRIASLPKGAISLEEVEKLVREGREKAPGEIAWALALAQLTAKVDAVAAVVDAAPADADAVEFALDLISERTEFTKDEAGRVREALAKVRAVDPRVPFQVGRAFKAAGNSDESKKEFARALDMCTQLKKGDAAAAHAGAILFDLADESAGADEDAWLERVVAVILKVAPNGEGVQPNNLGDETKNPVQRLARKWITASRWLDLYKLATQAGQNLLQTWELQQALQGDGAVACAKAVRQELLSEAKDVAPHKQYAKFAHAFLADEGTLEVLEAARTMAPKDVEVTWVLAETAGRRGERDKALAAYEAAIGMMEGTATVEGRSVTKTDGLIEMARLLQDPAKAKAALGRIDLKAAGTQGMHAVAVGELYAKIEEVDSALAAYMRAKELGLRPNFKIGRLHEKKKDPYEAVRWYNRDIAEGSTGDSWAGGQVAVAQIELDEPQPDGDPKQEGEPLNGKEAKERLLKKLGPDFLIERFLEGKFDALGDADRSAVTKAVEQFRSEELAERDAGEDALKKIGAKAAPHLKDLLKADDEEVRQRARALLMEWAEPR